MSFERNSEPDRLDRSGLFWSPGSHREASDHALEQLRSLKVCLPPEASQDLELTEGFFRSAIEQYDRFDRGEERRAGHHDREPSNYAFMVPVRTTATVLDPENPGPDYSDEVAEPVPIARWLNRYDCARIMRGLPPFLLDVLGKSGQGVLVYTPIGFDPAASIIESGGKMDDVAREFAGIANATANFSKYLAGSDDVVVGLGAVLPRFTDFGRSIENTNTTTGHAGTLHAILNTLKRLSHDTFNGELPNGHIGIMGAGAIGRVAASEISKMFPDKIISIYDIRDERSAALAQDIERSGGKSEAFVGEGALNKFFASTKVIVSAQTTPLDPRGLTMENSQGVYIIDDSEPKCVSPDIAERFGVQVVNVLVAGNDLLLVRNNFHYGGWIGREAGTVFACQAEAAVLSQLSRQNMISARVSGPAGSRDIAKIGRLFDDFGIAPPDNLQDAIGRDVCSRTTNAAA